MRIVTSSLIALALVGPIARLGLASNDVTAQSLSDNLFQEKAPATIGEQAPDWEVTQWANLPDGVDELEIDDYQGKTIYLYCFQSW